MKKLLGIIFSGIFITVLVAQLNLVRAKSPNSHSSVILPLTSPLPSPICKPGWGHGDTNHCHYGPPGRINK